MNGRESLDNLSTAAERLLTDPAWEKATTALRETLVKHIEEAELNGSHDAEKYVLELVRRLQAQAHYKKLLWRMIDQGKLTEHELERKKRFRSVGL